MSLTKKSINQLQLIIKLRFAAVAIQIILILFVNLGLEYQLPGITLFAIISTELVFTILSYFYYKNDVYKAKSASNSKAIFIQICADLLFLSLILFFSGGATNAFVSLLLIPIAIAAVSLTPTLLIVIALLAMLSYSILLWHLPMSVMHGNMEGHFIGMWINFILSASVVALVVGKMARNLNQQQLAIAAYRENLLKQEQVISLGVASAQITHQIATPISTVQLLTDELAEDMPNNEIINDMQNELLRCKQSLDAFRQMSFDIKEQVLSPILCANVTSQIADHIALNYPDITLKTHHQDIANNSILADASLLPAILNLLNNAIRASKANNSNLIELSSEIHTNSWQLYIRDFGTGFTLEKLAELGTKPVDSKQGLGVAVFLSYATLERLSGKLTLTNHQEGGALVTLTFPLNADSLATS
jgi:two-component system sensor histidine kinase RegB